MNIYDFSQVPSNLTTVVSTADVFVNAGILHNQGLMYANSFSYGIGVDADSAIVGNTVVEFAYAQELAGNLPSGSGDIIRDGMADFLSATSYSQGIKIWKDLFDFYKVDVTYTGTTLVAMLSIASYSAQFWSYAYLNWEEQPGPIGTNPPIPNFAKFALPKWFKTVAKDLGGALTGAPIGAGLASVVPCLGTGVGAVIGGIIGGVATSFG